MKQLFFISALAAGSFCFTGCGNNSSETSTNKDSSAAKTDSSATLIPPPDNSSATNPSMADTAFLKKDTIKDSSKIKHQPDGG